MLQERTGPASCFDLGPIFTQIISSVLIYSCTLCCYLYGHAASLSGPLCTCNVRDESEQKKNLALMEKICSLKRGENSEPCSTVKIILARRSLRLV